MTQTFTENVQVNGSADVTQMQVKSHTTQTQPLQAWQDSGGNTLARVTPDGRLQQGNLGLGTPAALVEANDSITLPSSKPKRAWHALGRISGALTDAIAWVVHELELLGSGGTSGIHAALRAKLTHNNTGSATSAELRAGDFQTVNQSGTSGARVGQIKGLRSAASNGPNAYLNKAVGVEATITNDAGGNVMDAVAFDVAMPTNTGTLANLYGLRVPTFSGLAGVSTDFASAQFEDDVELKLQSAMPVKNPPTNFIKLYTRLVGGVPKLYGKDSAGVEYEIGGAGTSALAGLIDVDLSTPPETGQALVYDDGSDTWKPGVPEGGGVAVVEELDGLPSVADVTTIRVNNGVLEDSGNGIVTIHNPGQTVFTYAGPLSVVTSPFRIYNNMGGTRRIVKVMCYAQVAPAGAAAIIDILKNGETIFTNQAHRPQITAGANTGQSTDIDIWAWADGEYLEMCIDQVGSTIKGTNLTVMVAYR